MKQVKLTYSALGKAFKNKQKQFKSADKNKLDL